MIHFEKTQRKNEVLMLEGGAYVSFRPGNVEDSAVLAADGRSAETAVCVDDEYYILNGDFRQEMLEAAQEGGLDACMAVYSRLRGDHISTWDTSAAVSTAWGSDDEKIMKWISARLEELRKEAGNE